MRPDSYDEMHRLPPTDDDINDRLLSGRMSALDAPESLRGVAALFEVAAGPASPDELARSNQVVLAATAAVLSSRPRLPTTPSRRKAMLSKVLTAKFAAAATVAAFGVGTAAAAAAGSLPGQTAHANHHAASGLATAASHQLARDQASSRGTSAGAPASGMASTGPANSHAQFGLCTAFLAAGSNQAAAGGASSPAAPPQYDSTAWRALIAANNGVAGTTTYCEGVVANHPGAGKPATTPSRPADAGKPATTPSRPADAGKPATTPSRPTDAGKPATTPGPPAGTGGPSNAGSSGSHAPVVTPNDGGTGTAATASRGASSAGSSRAATASNGASSAGSSNASGR